MRGWVLRNVGDIALLDVAMPQPAESEVRIKVMCAGVCGSDIPRIYRNGAHNMPLIPGHEFSGVVDEVGNNVSSDWIGKKVGIFPLIPCGKCGPCKSMEPQMCRNYDYVGSRRDGAFAEYVNVPASNLIKFPDSASFEQAAMLEPMAVAVHSMRLALGEGRSNVDSMKSAQDKKIVVCGLGTIGLLLIMFLQEAGYNNIYVIGNKPSQLQRVQSLGISDEHFCNSKEEDVPSWIIDKTGGADIYFECVGRHESVEYGLNVTSPGGKILLVGNPASDMLLDQNSYWKILRNQLTLQGTWNSRFLDVHKTDSDTDDWQYIIDRLDEGKIHPETFITHRLSMDDLEEGFLIMRDKKEDYCKVMLVNS